MTIQVGDRLPAGTLREFIEVETAGCTIGPNEFKVEDLTKGKKVVVFGLPGAFTPTCSAKHVPGYVAHYNDFKAKGVDDIVCHVGQRRVRDGRMGEGSAHRRQGAHDGRRQRHVHQSARARSRISPGMGVRSRRFSALIEDGVVKTLNVEAPGKFEVSDAETMLKQLG